MTGIWRRAAGPVGYLAGATALLIATGGAASAQQAGRVPPPPEGIAAFDRGEYGKAADIFVPAFDQCRAANPQGAACADLALAIAVLIATAGNAKTEPMILAAQAYIDSNVGRDSPDALAMLGAVTSYYDRLVDFDKYLPLAERRLALARKLQGPTGRTAVVAAVGLCVVQWNLGRGQAAVDLLTPLHGKLPQATPEDAALSGRVHECTGTAYYSMDRNREAEVAYRKALALYERAVGEKGDLTLDVMASLANTLRRLGREGEARTLAARITGLARPDSPVLGRIDWAGAPVGSPIEAARALLAQLERQYGANSPMADMAAAQLGIVLIEAGRMAEAEPYLARLAAAARNETTPASVRIKLMMGQIAFLAKQDGGRFDRALPVIEQLVAVAKQSGAGTDKLLIDFQMYAGAMLNRSGKPGRAYHYLSDAGRLLLARIASYRDFDAAAQSETREYSPIFRFKIATAWRLANPG